MQHKKTNQTGMDGSHLVVIMATDLDTSIWYFFDLYTHVQ